MIATFTDYSMKMLTGIPMEFFPYEEEEIRDIFISKAERAGFVKFVKSAPASTEFSSDDFSNDLDAFVAIIDAALPVFFDMTNHITELWENVMALWGKIFHSSDPSKFINYKQLIPSDTSTIDKSISKNSVADSEMINDAVMTTDNRIDNDTVMAVDESSDDDSDSDSSDDSVISQIHRSYSVSLNPRFLIDVKAVKAVAEDLCSMPLHHITSVRIQGDKAASGRKKTRRKPVIRLAKRGSVAVGAKVTVPGRLQAEAKDVNCALDRDICKYNRCNARMKTLSPLKSNNCSHSRPLCLLLTVHPVDWCSNIPLSEKYLILAAFLSSENHKSSDDFVFGGKKKGRRIKIAAGHDDEETAAAETLTADSSRCFSMDRMTSIFAQLATAGGLEHLGGGTRAAMALGHGAALRNPGEATVVQVAKMYGDCDLFSSVRMSCRYLLLYHNATSMAVKSI